MSVRNGLLALLSEGPKHGFQLKKEFEERTGALATVNVGQIYTTLARLERDGLVTASDVADGVDDQRDYRLTEDGRRANDSWFAEPKPKQLPDRDELVVKLTLAVELDRDVNTIIDQQRRVTTEALQQATRAKSRVDQSDLSRLFALDAAIAQIEAELRWLDLCQSRIRPGRSTAAAARPRTTTSTPRSGEAR